MKPHKGQGAVDRQWRRLHAPPDHQQHVGLGLLSGRLLGRQLGACHSGAGADQRDRAAFLRNNWWLFCRVSRVLLASGKEGLILDWYFTVMSRREWKEEHAIT